MKNKILFIAFFSSLSSTCLGWGVYGAAYYDPKNGHKVLLLGDYHQVSPEETEERSFVQLFNPYLKLLLSSKKPLTILVETNEEYFARMKTEIIKNELKQLNLLQALTILAKPTDSLYLKLLKKTNLNISPAVSVKFADYRTRSIKQIINLFMYIIDKSVQEMCDRLRAACIDPIIKNQLPQNNLLCANEFLFNPYLETALNINSVNILLFLKTSIVNYLHHLGYSIFSIQDFVNELEQLKNDVVGIKASPTISQSEIRFLTDQNELLEVIIRGTKQLFPDFTKSSIDAMMDLGVRWKDIAGLTSEGHELHLYSQIHKQEAAVLFEIIDSLVEHLADIGILLEIIRATQHKSDVFLVAGVNHVERLGQQLILKGYQELIKIDQSETETPLDQNALKELFTFFNP